jgi:Cyclic nucleotide-binding domain
MSDFDSESLERLFGLGPMRNLARDEPLFRQGEPAAAVFLILHGRLRMVRNLASGDRITIHTGRTGELFAEGVLPPKNLEPASSAVPAAATDKQYHDYNDQKSCGVHGVLPIVHKREMRSGYSQKLQRASLKLKRGHARF